MRRIQRAIMERELRRREATFQPRLASSAPARVTARAAAPGNFEERLHPSEQQLLEKKARAEALKLMQDLDGCTFQVRGGWGWDGMTLGCCMYVWTDR